jgi:TonB family protein
MQVTVLPEGFASNVVVTRSSGAARLDDAARVDVGSTWRWQPRSGRCNPAQTKVRVVFSLLDAH